jgi:hypothetical protein
MEGLLKYFETLYKLSDVLYGYSELEHKQYNQLEKIDTSEHKTIILNVEKRYSIADDEKVKKFFKTILDYYYHQDNIPLNHTSIDIKEEVKVALIKRVPDYYVIYNAKAIKMYDLMDYMFLTLKKVLLNTKKGYNEALKVMGPNSHLDFRKEISNISMYLYITFIHIFPTDLRLLLKKTLHIDDLDQKIMDKCHGIIIRHNQERVCNIKRDDSPTSPITSPFLDAEQEYKMFDFLIDLPGQSIDDKPDIALKSKYSIGMLLNIFSIIQGRKRF